MIRSTVVATPEAIADLTQNNNTIWHDPSVHKACTALRVTNPLPSTHTNYVNTVIIVALQGHCPPIKKSEVDWHS